MQEFEEENISDSMFDAGAEPEVQPENVPEIASGEQSQDEAPPEAIDPPQEQEDVVQESPREKTPPPQKQSQTRNYYAPVFENDFQDDFEPQKIEVSTVSKESTVLGEVLDKKFDELVTVQPVRFANFDNDDQTVGPPRKNLDIMQDVGMRLTVELGRTRMKVRKLLDITKGSIIEIDKMAGDQAELFVCGKLVARGEVIVIEDKFGLRIASIVEQKE